MCNVKVKQHHEQNMMHYLSMLLSMYYLVPYDRWQNACDTQLTPIPVKYTDSFWYNQYH